MDEKTHHAIDELNLVHSQMKRYYIQDINAQSDIIKASKMENYLRQFKSLAETRFEKSLNNKVDFQRSLEIDGMNEILDMVESMLGSKYLFHLGHHWSNAQEIAKKTGADDIFEAQLYALLEKAGQYALQEGSESIQLGISIIGEVKGNTVKNVNLIQKRADKIVKEVISKIGENEIAKAISPSDIITPPTYRAAKTDVTGYSKTINIKADIKPEWQDFIRVFQGANFSLKNYSSGGKGQVIHLGNTNSFKAMYGVLNTIGFKPTKSEHIYIHTRISYLFGHTAAQGEGPSHIIHMRFAYELTGAGLYDEQGNKMDEVDFFIYNDPNSENIYVRSTKQMIKDVFEYLDISKIGDPWTSGIVITKSAF